MAKIYEETLLNHLNQQKIFTGRSGKRVIESHSDLKTFKKAMAKRDKKEKELQQKLLSIAAKYTRSIISGNPHNTSNRLSAVLSFSEDNIKETGRGKNDTYYTGFDSKTQKRVNDYNLLNDTKKAQRNERVGNTIINSAFSSAQVFSSQDMVNFERLFNQAVRQSRSTATFHFELSYDYKKVYKRAILYGKKVRTRK